MQDMHSTVTICMHSISIHITQELLSGWMGLAIPSYYRLLEISVRLLEITGDYQRLLEIATDYYRLLQITGEYQRLLYRVLQITGDYQRLPCQPDIHSQVIEIYNVDIRRRTVSL